MIRLRLFGGASLAGPDGPIAGRGAQRRRLALLALLAVARRPIARDKLIAWLWPDDDTATARKLLSDALYVLRRDVDDQAIETAGDQVRLDPTRVACDVVEFEEALERGDAAAAVALYDGPFLDGFFLDGLDEFERWATGERERLERRYRDALEQLATAAALSGDARAASAWWRKLAAQDPYDGRVALALMNALVASGDRAGALQHARVHEALLREELGAAPDAELVHLAARLRAGDAPGELAEPRPPLATPTHAVGPISPGPVTKPSSRAERLRAELNAALSADFEIGRLLGEGSTACVFLARDVALDKTVSVKVLNPELVSSEELRTRFERAAQAAANVEHPNVAAVHRFGVLPAGEPYVIMQYVRGRTLAQRLAAEGALSVAATRHVLMDVAAALAAAHAAGVVHRDVRPDNILLDESGERALLTDFGLAGLTEVWAHTRSPRVTRTGQVLGDPRWLSPEQAQAGNVTEATDLYSLALVAIEVLTARARAEGDRQHEATARLRGEAPAVPDWIAAQDPGLASVLRACLAPTPELRPSARTVAARLREPVRAGVDPDPDPWPWLPAWLRAGWAKLARRHVPQWVAAVAASGIVVLGVTADLNDDVPLPPIRAVLTTAVAAIVAAGVLAWFHGERGEQRFRLSELGLLAAIVVAWIAALIAVL